jgi:hypothetical protein
MLSGGPGRGGSRPARSARESRELCRVNRALCALRVGMSVLGKGSVMCILCSLTLKRRKCVNPLPDLTMNLALTAT